MSEAQTLLAGMYTILRKHLEGHKCDQCLRHYNSLLRVTNIALEEIGKPHVFSNSRDIGEMDGTDKATRGKVRHGDAWHGKARQGEDAPETVTVKALRIFGRKE